LSVFRRSNGAALTVDADRSSFFIALVVVDIFVGLADAISGPYIVLFLVDKAGLGPLGLSAILTVRALSAIAFSTAFGAWIDKRTTLAPLLLALAGSSVGYALLGFTTNFVVLFIIAAVPIAIGSAAFSQSIALVKREFNRASLTPSIAPSASCAPAFRWRGPSDPQSAPYSSGQLDFAAPFSPAPRQA
jgi:MFS family permease